MARGPLDGTQVNLAQAAALFAAMQHTLTTATHKALDDAAKIVKAEAKREIGDYQPVKGPFAEWAELKSGTKSDRVKQGFPENEPLLRTGALRDSIEHTVKSHHEAEVGSDSLVAVYQELGTTNIPPRSFLGGAAFSKSHEVKALLGSSVIATIMGKKAI